MSDYYVLIGHYNPEFTNYFAANGISYYIIKDAKRHAESDDNSVVIDFSDKDALWQAIGDLPHPPTCVFTMYEQYIPLAADINKRLGLRHALSPEAAQASTDKILMRDAFSRAPEPISPPYILAENEAQIKAFAEQHDFPVILKPANLSKSLLVSRCDTVEELLAAWQEATSAAPVLYEKLTDGLEPRFILERFMPGSVHTVLGFADKDGRVVLAKEIVDNITAKDAGFDDSFIFSRTIPSQLDAGMQEALLHCSRLGMEALGLRSCAAHIELIVTNEGPRIIEIGARVGGYRTKMYRFASGIDVIGATLQAYRGEQPRLAAQKQEHCRVIEAFPRAKGQLKNILNFEEAAKLPSVVSASQKFAPGATVGKASQGFKASAIFVLHHASKEQIEADYRFIQRQVTVETA